MRTEEVKGAVANATKPPMPEFAESLAGAMPALGPAEQQLALAVYRRLAAGDPVPPSALATELGRGEAEVDETLDRWPGVYRDDAGRVIGFRGLAIPEMPHRFRVDDRQLHTWCAWDALFIPELIGRTAEVESRRPRAASLFGSPLPPTG